MRTAKEIIEEYRARGYGMESLRVLADSRDEPLRSEMLALLSQEAEGGVAAADDMVFFLVSDDEGVEEVGGDVVDFDILASDADALANNASFLAADEESVAELAIGDDEGTDFVQIDAEGHETSVAEIAGEGLDNQAAAGEETVPIAPLAKMPETAAVAESGQAAVLASAAMPETVVLAEEGGRAEGGDGDARSASVGETADQSSDYLPGSAVEASEEPETVMEQVAADALGDGADTSVAKQEEPLSFVEDAVEEAASDGLDLALAFSGAEQTESEGPAEGHAEENAAEQTPPLDILADAFPLAAENAQVKKESASERRRRRREERKRAKAEKKIRSKEKKAADKLANRLPEIVLSSSEDTETLSQESCRDMTLFGVSDIGAPEESDGDDASIMIPASANLDLCLAETRDGPDSPRMAEDAEAPDPSFTSYYFDSHGENTEEEEENAVEACDEQNIIRLYDDVDMDEGDVWSAAETEDADGGFAGSLLLPESAAETGSADDPGGELSPMAKIGLLRALTGGETPVCDFEDMTDEVVNLEKDHVIVQPGAEPVASPALDETVIAEMEKDYQARLDEFAKRLLELQASVAESETRLREKSGALEDKEREAAALTEKLRTGEEAIRTLTADIASLSDDLTRKSDELDNLKGLKGEHQRLYREFEDLRGAYNEVVTNVMPTLQNERDELVETVERQGEDEENLRRALKTSGRRMAVGYSLAAAAAVMMVALPLTHWLGAGGQEQQLALGHQKAGELYERLEKAERRNVEAEKIIFNLEQQSNLAHIELAKLDKANKELTQLSDKRTRELAQIKANLAGTGSSRAALGAGDSLGLAGPVGSDGKLRVNEVRDPGGSIETVLAENRERFAREDAAVLASSNPSRANNLQISAVATTRAPAPGAPEQRQPAGGQVAVVKKGEGVAQVVYRVMGTRDPQVIAWVIKENKLKKDKKNNPIIFPDQKLRLPAVPERNLNQANAAKR